MTNANLEAYKRGLRYKIEIFSFGAQRMTPEFVDTRTIATERRKTLRKQRMSATVFKITESGGLERISP